MKLLAKQFSTGYPGRMKASIVPWTWGPMIEREAHKLGPAGITTEINGEKLSLSSDTDVGLGIVDSDGNGGAQFVGGVRWHKAGSPDPIFTEGKINFGSGDFEFKGKLNHLPVTFTAQGNAVSGQGKAAACLQWTSLCRKNIPFQMHEPTEEKPK